MRPVAFLQHDKTQRAGSLARYLEQIGVPTRLICPEEGDGVPRRADDFSGIVLLGSNRSVNEPVDWIGDEVDLVQRAMRQDIPVLGHCFGAQLMARSLGARVCRNAWANIGWSRLQVTPPARHLFEAEHVVGFNWHYETFAIPAGAHRLLYGGHCLNKAFGIGKHLAFQCHFEVTEEIVREWCTHGEKELSSAWGPAVQSRAQILSQLRTHLPDLQATALTVYRKWAASLPRPVIAHRHGGW